MRSSEVYSCANGLKTLVWQRREAPVVSVQVWVETGSMLEGQYVGSGISHLLEHMVFKGTDEYSASELGEAVSALGGLWNAYTGTDRTVFHIDGPAEHWREFLHILAQLTLHPTFPENEWEPERNVIRREMDMYRDDPDDAAYTALIGTLYKKHPRRFPVIGLPEVFDALTPADMRRYHAERYVPGNMFVCVVGDVEPAAVADAAEQEFGSAPAAPFEPPCLPEEPRQWGPRLHRCEFAQPTSTLMLAWRTPHSNHPDMPALALLASILGDGRTAWLYRRFHDECAQAHDISTLMIPHSAGEGALVIEADVDRPKRDSLRDALLAWLAELPQADFSAALRRALRQQKARHVRGLATVHGAADVLAGFWRHYRHVGAYDEWLAALERVTPQDMQRVAREWLSPHRLVEVSVDPTGTNSRDNAASAQPDKMPVHSFTLDNGLRCVLRVDKRIPMVCATLALGAGCRVESAENSGVCSLLAECLPKGTVSRSSAEIAEFVENLGGSLRCITGNNSLLLSINCLSEDTAAMLELLADVALHPSLPDDAVQTAREDMLTDLQDELESPMSLAMRKLRSLCFGAVSYGNTPTGSLESLSALTREDTLQMHARLMRGSNAVLALVGDMDAEAMEAHVRRFFAAMPAGDPPGFEPTPPQRAGDETYPAPPEKEQAVLAMALPGLSVSHPDGAKLLLFDSWCQDASGPVFSEIREKRGLSYHASSGLLIGTDAGSLFFSLQTSPRLLEQARAALVSLLEQLAADGMPPEALERSKAMLLASRRLASQSISKICSALALDVLYGLGAEHEEQLTAAIAGVSHEAMQDFIRRHLLLPSAPRAWVSVV